jgi:tripartite-type tricarboxylate transporter receptor subunit TctC
MTIRRRDLLALGAGALAAPALLPRAAFGQSKYPERPIRLIVPFPPGGAYDTVARPWAERIKPLLGQIVIENIGGSGGAVGAAAATRAQPDGYTIVHAGATTHITEGLLKSKPLYDPMKDLVPISGIAVTVFAITVHPSVPAKDLKEFIAYVKANETKVNAAHAGVGSVSNVSCELLNSVLGVKPIGVPFNGTGPAMNALVAGQVDYMCDQIVNAVPQINGGTIKAYAVATAERNPSLPNVPTTTEAGLPAFQAQAWNAIFAPKGTPADVVAKLNAAIVKALDDEGVRKRLLDLGSVIPAAADRTPAALGTLVKNEVAKWTPVLKPVN